MLKNENQILGFLWSENDLRQILCCKLGNSVLIKNQYDFYCALNITFRHVSLW